MPGSATFDSYPLPLDGVAVRIAVYRYDSTQPTGERLGPAIPNVRCVAVQWFDGPHPQAARFEYVFDDSDPNSPYPDQFEDVWPLDAPSKYIINNDDELLVFAYDQNGNRTPIFHGFAQIPQTDLASTGQAVTFAAVGVAVRLWDTPIAGSTWRQSDQINSHDVKDTVATDLPTHFNPLISLYGNPVMKKNCTPDDQDVNEGTDTAYPVFLDPYLQLVPDPYTFWTLGKLARYLMQTYNKDQKYIKNPVASDTEAMLENYAPKAGQFFDPNDSSTYTANPIDVRDFNATNMAWLDALYQAIAPHGFSLNFILEADDNGEPVNSLQIYRKDAKTPWQPKQLNLQQSGAVLDPGATNVNEFHASRDNHSIANRFIIESEPVLYEVSIILAPGYQPASGDETTTNRKQFTRKEIIKDNATPVIRTKYRRYVANEDGSGFWDFKATPPAFATTPLLDMTKAFGTPPPQPDGQPGEPQYVKRCRVCHDTLISKDSSGRPYKAQLAISRDYTGSSPGFWDGTGTWEPCSGGWELLKDRIGIYLNVDDPEMWHIGVETGSAIQAGGVVRGIRSMSNPDASAKRFYLRLTTVIEADQVMEAIADIRKASPTQFAITRRISAGDHFQKQILAPQSLYNQSSQPVTDPAGGKVRDDTTAALAFAGALRSAHEMPPLGGTVTLPYVSLAYTIGDRIDLIRGRNVSLRTNIGASQGEAPTLPWIEQISFAFGGDNQSTVIQFADRRPEPVRF